jgi:hypothetical protein
MFSELLVKESRINKKKKKIEKKRKGSGQPTKVLIVYCLTCFKVAGLTFPTVTQDKTRIIRFLILFKLNYGFDLKF